jgi:hypothetical protein
MALAAAGTGTPLPCPMLDLLIADRLCDGAPPDPTGWARELAADYPDQQDRLGAFIEDIIAERAPIWRRLGVLPRGPAT